VSEAAIKLLLPCRFHVLLDLLSSALVVPARCASALAPPPVADDETSHPTIDNTQNTRTRVTLQAHLESGI